MQGNGHIPIFGPGALQREGDVGIERFIARSDQMEGRLNKIEGSYDALKVVRPMTITVVSVVLAAIAVVIGILGAQVNATNTKIDALNSKMDTKFDAINKTLIDQFHAMHDEMAAQVSAISNAVTATRNAAPAPPPQIIVVPEQPATTGPRR